MATVGVTSMLALVGPPVTPGPIIGPGGYLGAAGRALLEINFATAGAFILTISLLVGGLLLCTDHLLIRLTAWTVRMPFRLVGSVGRSAGRTGATAEDDADDEPVRAGESVGEPAVVIRGKRREGAAADDEDHDQNGDKEIPVTAAVASSEESTTEESSEAADEEDCENAAVEARIRRPLASALRIRNLGKNDQQEMLDELDAAADRSDEVIDYELPSLDLLAGRRKRSPGRARKRSPPQGQDSGKDVLNFGFNVKVVEIETGPVIAQFEVELEAGLRLSKITSLADDLAIALRVPSVRIVAPIPGKNTVGIEVPNDERQLVRLREVIEETNGKRQEDAHPDLPGQGRGRQSDGRRPDHAAALADRRPHRHGQERVLELDHRVDAHDAPARRSADADDRPQDGRAQPVQEAAAPDAPGRHRHAQGRGDPGLGRRQDGRTLRAAGPGRRAAHQRLQPARRRRADGPPAARERRRTRSTSRATCRTS